jgi:hypothetical protein
MKNRKNLHFTCIKYKFKRENNISKLISLLKQWGQWTLWDGIHESRISLRFLGIILRFLWLEVSTNVFAFLQNHRVGGRVKPGGGGDCE